MGLTLLNPDFASDLPIMNKLNPVKELGLLHLLNLNWKLLFLLSFKNFWFLTFFINL